jgi:hypothetical protein
VTISLGSILLSIEAAYSGLYLLRTRTAGTPAGDQDDSHEDNDFDLPNGNPIRRKIKQFAHRQLKKILGTIPEIGAPLPASFPSLTDWNDPMASAMTPIISAYWDVAGKTTRARLGLDPDAWEVHDPHLHQMVSQASLKFCKATNATTDLNLQDALDKLRQELISGLVDSGDSVPELAKRVKGVFARISDWRAEMIGRTEASRAVHSASLQSAKESGVVRGKKWLVSANSCDKCVAKAAEFNGKHGIPLDASFGGTGSSDPDYADCDGPPLHPHCRCSLTYVLTGEYEELLKLHPPGSDFQPGPIGPEPKPERKVASRPKPEPKPKPAPALKPAPPAKPTWTWGTPVEPSKPIAERIRLSPAWERARQLREIGVEVLAARQKARVLEDELSKAISDGTALFKGGAQPSEADKARVLARINAAKAGAEAARKERMRATGAANDRVKAIIAPPKGANVLGWRHDTSGVVKGDYPAKVIQNARDFVEPLLARAPGDPARLGAEWRTIAATAEQRAHCVLNGPIFLPVAESSGTAVHEWGHRIEDAVPGARKAAQEFLAYRVKGEPLRPMADLIPGRKFRSGEMGREDDFRAAYGDLAAYAGKHYGPDSTEITSMALELLYNDPHQLAANDVELTAFLLGILDGSLRSP